MSDCNQLTALPDLPLYLTYMSCSYNQLTSLPSLPYNLRNLYCSQNPLEALPELPSTLVGLACVLPHNDQIYISNELTPDIVKQLNDENQELMAQSKKRCTARCKIYKEEIMMKAWHPTRMKMLYELGYDVEDM
jgi:Leucine-rich repeat (LRR) protein